MMIHTAKFASPAYVCELLGESRSTVINAIDAGSINSVRMKCGTLLVEIASARRRAKSDRPRGRPPKAEPTLTLDGPDGSGHPNYRALTEKKSAKRRFKGQR